MPQQFSPLPETDMVAGKPVDSGYDPAQWREHERESRTYERKAMEAVAKQPVIEKFQVDTSPEELGWWDAVLHNEATLVAQDLGRHTWTTAKNIAASTLGMPADVIQFALDARFSGTAGTPPQIPGTSEDFANVLGGDVDHPSWLPAALVAPGPGEAAALKTLIGGAVAAPRVSKVSRLEEFNKMDVPNYDFDGFQKTGWYRGEDGAARFFISDADATVTPIEDLLTKGNYSGTEGAVRIPLDQVLSHPELYKAYPELAKFPIKINWAKTDEGIRIVDPARSSTNARLRINQRSGTRTLQGLEFHNVSDVDQFRRTTLHEVQHVIQEIEDFAIGGQSARMSDLNKLTKNEAVSVAFDAIDGGATTPDELGEALMFQNLSESGVDELLRSGDVQAYLAGSDTFRNEFRVGFAGEQAAVRDKVTAILDYLLIDNEARGMEYLEEIKKAASSESMSNLSFRAYENLYGEAEARLVEDLADSTMETLRKKGPQNPAEASRTFPQDEGIPLSISKTGDLRRVAQAPE